MAIAQGINKVLSFKKQTGLGVAASGSGGQIMRRETSKFELMRDTYENNEIASHQQSTGVAVGSRKTQGALNGVLSLSTYTTLIASLLRKQFAATTSLTATAVTIAGSGPYTVTIGTGSFLTNGFKIGDVIRLSVGTLNAANINKNLQITALTATVATVRVVNGSTMVAEGPIAGCTIAAPGKKCIAPITGQTTDYWTVEEWQPDISRSELFTDTLVASIDIGLPAKGNATFAANFVGLNRSIGASQILTTPTAVTTTDVLTASNGIILVNGTQVANITGATIKIDGNTQVMDSVVGSLVSPDAQRGRIKVSGQITAFYQDGVLPGLFDAGTLSSAVIVVTNDATAASEFVAFSMSALTFTGDSPDDGEKGVIRTYPFIAEINGAGGAALANDQTIISIQDSLAP